MGIISPLLNSSQDNTSGIMFVQKKKNRKKWETYRAGLWFFYNIPGVFSCEITAHYRVEFPPSTPKKFMNNPCRFCIDFNVSFISAYLEYYVMNSQLISVNVQPPLPKKSWTSPVGFPMISIFLFFFGISGILSEITAHWDRCSTPTPKNREQAIQVSHWFQCYFFPHKPGVFSCKFTAHWD